MNKLLRRPIEEVQNSKINISPGKVYIDGVEIDGIFEMAINDLEESASSLDTLAEEASQISVSFRQLAGTTIEFKGRLY